MNNKPQAIADKDYVYGAISIIGEIFDTPSTCAAWWHWQCSDWDDCTAAVFSVASFFFFLFSLLCLFFWLLAVRAYQATKQTSDYNQSRGCNKCWISVLLKKATSTLHFFQTHYLIYLLPIESNLLPQTLDYEYFVQFQVNNKALNLYSKLQIHKNKYFCQKKQKTKKNFWV